MKVRLAIAMLGAALLARCGCAGGGPWAVATVEVDLQAATRCVIVVARGTDGGRGTSGAVETGPGGRLKVAVFQGDLGSDILLRAEGYGDPDCAAGMDEASAWRGVRFDAGAPVQVTLGIFPEGPCADGLDGDGDGLVDCADRACAGAPGCGGADAGDGGNPDAGSDGGFPYVPSNFLPGPLSWPDSGTVIDCDAGYDTTSTSGWFCGAPVPAAVPISMAGGAEAILLPLGPLTITPTGRLTAIGDRPLILAVRGDARIDGVLLAGADQWRPGPGGSRPSCPGTGWLGADGGYGGGGGGGGGGGYGQPGAHGGAGGSNGPGPGGNGGATFGAATLVPLLGGCSGGEGGENESLGLRTAGTGGGAIQVSATGVLRVQAVVAAPGGGGEGGESTHRCGGGGGGSGGGILLEALRLELGPDARVTANGGAGSEGSDPGVATYQFGENGRIDGPYPARGGNTSAAVGSGGDGGTGGASPTPGRDYPTSSGGGGGGGGGAGRIRVTSVQGCVLSGSADLLFSPRPTSNLAGDAGCP